MAIGDRVLDWTPQDGRYWLWSLDPKSADPLTGPLRQGQLPEGFDAGTALTGIQPQLPIDPARARPRLARSTSCATRSSMWST